MVLEDFFVPNKTIFFFYLDFRLPHYSRKWSKNKIQTRFSFSYKGKYNLRRIIMRSNGKGESSFSHSVRKSIIIKIKKSHSFLSRFNLSFQYKPLFGNYRIISKNVGICHSTGRQYFPYHGLCFSWFNFSVNSGRTNAMLPPD